jgi:hypothetical protein
LYGKYIPINQITVLKMDPFYTYVSIGAVVILVLVLIAFGVMMSQLHSTDLFPPTYQKCPDMWVVDDTTGGCVIPKDNSSKNRGKLNARDAIPYATTSSGDGTLAANSTDDKPYVLLDNTSTGTNAVLKLNDSNIISQLYPAISDRCSKKQWALTNEVIWDGVTNYNAC